MVVVISKSGIRLDFIDSKRLNLEAISSPNKIDKVANLVGACDVLLAFMYQKNHPLKKASKANRGWEQKQLDVAASHQ